MKEPKDNRNLLDEWEADRLKPHFFYSRDSMDLERMCEFCGKLEKNHK